MGFVFDNGGFFVVASNVDEAIKKLRIALDGVVDELRFAQIAATAQKISDNGVFIRVVRQSHFECDTVTVSADQKALSATFRVRG